MSHLSSPAIVLRTTEHGDYDKIVTCFTRDYGKTALIAKGAKKSVKRFAGILELFSALNVVWQSGRSRGLPILQEASVIDPYEQIRTDIVRTAYASYWCELVCQWMEAGQEQPALYRLLEYVLEHLNAGTASEAFLHIVFQLHFLDINGFRPAFTRCTNCQRPIDEFGATTVTFNVRQGGILCDRCGPPKPGILSASKGTVKILSWILNTPLTKLHRIRLSGQALEESLRLLEAFVPYHLGKETKSLKFLKQLTALSTP